MRRDDRRLMIPAAALMGMLQAVVNSPAPFMCVTSFFVAALLSGLLASPVVAQYRFDAWTIEDGLPQNSVYAILQTRDGYLWFATLDGLVRFDGMRFTVFDKATTPGINSNRFVELFEDRGGNLWIGTEDGGLTRYREGAFVTYTPEDGLPDHRVLAICEDGAGNLLVATRKGLAQWREEAFVPYAPLSAHTADRLISCLYKDRSGALWYADASGLHRLKDGNRLTYTARDGLASLKINRIYEDRQGAIWITTRDAGVNRLKDGRLTAYTMRDGLPSNGVGPVCEDRKGTLWMATNQGACLFRNSGFTALPVAPDPSSNFLATVYADREGSVWVGTLYHGLLRVAEQAVTVYSTKDGLRGDNVYPIYQDRASRIWLGGSALTVYQNGVFEAPLAKDITGVTALHEDRQRRLWLGRWQGAAYLKDGTVTDFSGPLGISESVYAIHQDREGSLWFGTESRLVKYRDGRVAVYTGKDGLAGGGVTALLEDRAGHLWVGSYGGLTLLKEGGALRFTEQDGLPSNRVRALYEDGEGTLWIGTYDGGLGRFREGRFTRYTVRDGLFNNGVFQILEDSRGNFWMSCNRGIYRVSRRQLNDFADGRINRLACVAYGRQDGLAKAECNGGQQPAGIRARDGRLWFPAQGGVAVLDPETIPFNPQPPPVTIEACRLDGDRVSLRQAVEVAPGNENLEISYAGLSFIKPEQVRFKYRLAGLDHDWVDAGNRRAAYYSHLPPGRYTFTVIAANSDGVWNEEGASIQILVAPPFWKTGWFLSLAVCGVIILAVLVYERRVLRLRRAAAAQEAFSRRLITSQESERQRIAAELHDSLGQSLAIIKSYALFGLETPADAEYARAQFEQIAAQSTQAIDEVKEISYNLRPYLLDRLGLTRALESMLNKVARSSGIAFTTEVAPLDGLLPKEAEISLYRIVQESLNNIVKHAAASRAQVTIRREADLLTVRIQDDGKGFAPEEKVNSLSAAGEKTDGRQGGFGLIGMAERARMLGGSYAIHSAPGRGTTVTLTIEAREGRA